MVAIESHYYNNKSVIILTNLDDLNQPFSCEQWGDRHQMFDSDIYPLMTDDGNQRVIWGWLNSGGAFPSTAYINHDMVVTFKGNTPSFGTALARIDSMLEDCGQLCENSTPEALFDYEINDNTVSFLDFSSFSSEGWNIDSWLWDFGDGNTSDNQNPTHTYDSDGLYQVSLIIDTDVNCGQSEPFIADVQIGVLDTSEELLPSSFGLTKNYPNPFNPNTTIEYNLIESGLVSLDIYDINGKLIDNIVNSYQMSGKHSIIWQPNNISSGMYYINLVQGMNIDKMKLMYIK
tara:strand:- start:115 stop:981 length:867 start_codon:yes stop_codon:yes gene_type:complete